MGVSPFVGGFFVTFVLLKVRRRTPNAKQEREEQQLFLFSPHFRVFVMLEPLSRSFSFVFVAGEMCD